MPDLSVKVPLGRTDLKITRFGLGLDRIDILLIHDPEDYLEQAFKGTYHALRKMRDDGMISAIGAGMNFSHHLLRLA